MCADRPHTKKVEQRCKLGALFRGTRQPIGAEQCRSQRVDGGFIVAQGSERGCADVNTTRS